MPRQPSTCRRSRPSFVIRGGGCVRRNLYLPSSPTCTHLGAPPCTHHSVHCVRSINDFSTLRQQNWTGVGFEFRLLPAQDDSVSTDRQHQRFASPFHPSGQLDQKRCENLPETGVPEMISFFPQKGQAKARASSPFHPSQLACPPLHQQR